MTANRSALRSALRWIITAPGVRLLAPGWPDTGRRIVQRPVLEGLLARAVENRPGPRSVLNAGCGEGLYSPTLRQFAADATLFEFDYARPPRSAAPDQHRFSASLDAIAVQSGTMHLVLCTEVLEHVRDDESAVSELRRVMAHDGYLVLSVPTPPAVFDPAHVREGYTLAALNDLFSRHGLEIVEARYSMYACFRAVLRFWRPRRVPLGIIMLLAWLDTWLKVGPPMDIAVLARPAIAEVR